MAGTYTSRRSVLAITSQLPWPLDRGGHIRTFNLLRALASELDVTLIVPLRPGQQALLSSLQEAGITTDGVLLPTAHPVRAALRLGQAWLAQEPYVLYRRHYHPEVMKRFLQLTSRRKFDVAYLDHLDSFSYAQPDRFQATVIDLHNIYSLLARRTSAEQRSRTRVLFLRQQAMLLDRVERRAVKHVSAVFAVSEAERCHFQNLGAPRAFLVPNGVECARYRNLPIGARRCPPLVLYVGTLSWGPNATAASFLAREVLPTLKMTFPNARLRLIGRHPSPPVAALAQLPGVEVMSDVADIRPHLEEASVLAVPLEAGGGTRLKILEAFAAGLPVVSTPVGAEGLSAVHRSHLMIAERRDFPAAIAELVTSPDLADALAARARRLVELHYDWTVIGQTAIHAVLSIV